ncbi:hypothetical protein R1flu_024934 [Riccia fluitans]|uniref:Uncharacterized protein n=1 Tax=Riccia fluitans TaxID=41844 RepID=A0ABD1XWG0_9MARC
MAMTKLVIMAAGTKPSAAETLGSAAGAGDAITTPVLEMATIMTKTLEKADFTLGVIVFLAVESRLRTEKNQVCTRNYFERLVSMPWNERLA